MEVILLQRVKNLGNVGDFVKVRPGYARNYLIPTHRAVMATEANRAKFEAERAEYEKAEAAKLAAAEERKSRIEALGVVKIQARAGNEGKLFGSVGTHEIADAVTAAGVEVTKSEVRLPAGALRQVGEHEVGLHLHSDVDVNLTVSIVPGE
jgi:large subunit ribosomal protein L9